MKRVCIFTMVFLAVGLYSVTAQDLIVLKNGDMIEAKVTEISPTEIKYKRYNNLDGPTIVVLATDVLSIRYEEGTTEVINNAPVSSNRPGSSRSEGTQNTAINPDKFIFGINGNPGGAIGYLYGGSGVSVNVELGKGNFNSEINLLFPVGGFGFLATFNGFWHSRIGGFYLGGGVGFSFQAAYDDIGEVSLSLPLGLNIGYKFVTPSGLYFRTGTFVGYDFLWSTLLGPVYIKPDLAIGWTMR